MHCFAQCPRIVFVFLGVTLDSAEKNPLLKPPFLGSQIFFFSDFFCPGGQSGGFPDPVFLFCFIGLFSFSFFFFAERAGEKKQKKKAERKKQGFSVYFSVFLSAGNRKTWIRKKHQTHPQREKNRKKQIFSVRFIFSFFSPAPSAEQRRQNIKNWKKEN